MCDCLWSDPSDNNGRFPSKRGISVMFGPDVTERFCNDNDLSKSIFHILSCAQGILSTKPSPLFLVGVSVQTFHILFQLPFSKSQHYFKV